MHRELLITNDGSHTISIPSMGVSYHSHHGAIQESIHVFINAGLEHYLQIDQVTKPLYIFEMGFGTGLNALLTLIKAEELQRPIIYETLELFPIENDLAASLNYCDTLNRPDLEPAFLALHHSDWEEEIRVTEYFTIKKIRRELTDFVSSNKANIIYFDAFSPDVQPELWTASIFSNLFAMTHSNGVLVTYSSKSDVRRALMAVGFKVEKIPGPQGKREMVRAVRV